VQYPIGHRRRRTEGMPLLIEKFKRNLGRCFGPGQQQAILEVCLDRKRLGSIPVQEFVGMFVK